jgi:tetratricopeptide (TPR) repeat protein
MTAVFTFKSYFSGGGPRLPKLSLPSLKSNWLAIVGILCLLTGCADKYERAASYATQSEALLAAGNMDEARLNIQKAIAERDDVAAFYILLGRIEVRAQRSVNAFNAYSLALDLEADNLEILTNIADLGLQTGRVHEAEEAANRILLLAPSSTGAMLIKGFIAIDQGRFDDASRAASDIIAINPQDEGGVILSARIDALQGRTAQALAKVDQSAATIGATRALNITRLEILRALGNAQGMADIFPQILKDMTDNSELRLDYINLLYKNANKQAARREGYALLLAEPNNRAILTKLTSLWMEHDDRPLWPAALNSIIATGSQATRIMLARHYLATDQPEVASRLIPELVSARVAEAVALNARILLDLGRNQEAYANAAAVLREDTRNEDALLVRSAHAMSQKNYDRAIEDANVVVSDAPLNPMGYVALAQAHFAKGTTIRARQIYEKGLDALPQSLLLASYYQTFLRKLGDTARLISVAREVAVASPSSNKAWSHYLALCQRYADSGCSGPASAGLVQARKSYVVDEPPGTPRRRGLFARITPEKLCSTTGGICTEI